MVKLEDKDLYQLLMSEFRYSVRRDNHLAPGTCVQHIKEYLPRLTKQWRAHIAEQLTEEIIDERLWLSDCFRNKDFKFENDLPFNSDKKQLHEDCTWEELLVFLTNYLERLPYNVDRYMTYIYEHMTYSKGIDYYSAEIQDKLMENRKKA